MKTVGDEVIVHAIYLHSVYIAIFPIFYLLFSNPNLSATLPVSRLLYTPHIYCER